MTSLLLLLLIALSWERGTGCMEQRPCPAAPLIKNVPPSTAQYAYSNMTGPETVNGDKIYKCKYGVLTWYGAQNETLSDDAALVCKVDSGNFVRRYTNGSEVLAKETDTYVCRETRCPPPALDAGAVTVPSPFAVTSCPLTTATKDDITNLVCSPGGILYDVSNASDPIRVEPDKAPKCPRASGAWSTDKKVYKCLTTPFIGIETDSCSKELHPELLKLDQVDGYWNWTWTVCRNDWPKIYVVRGIDESGKRVTLDNDQYRYLRYVPNRGGCGGMWEYVDTVKAARRRPNVYLKAATCAIADSKACPCEALPQMPAPNGRVGVPVWLEGERVCKDENHTMNYYWFKPNGDVGLPTWPKIYRLTCMAGIWMMVNTDSPYYPGWKIEEGVCFA